MRDFKGMKRQRGRNRGGGGKPQQQNANRAFDSNGPEGIKVRGNPQHVFEKYQQLARDASSSGDRVLAENYLQHAEHYFRLLRALQPQRPASEIIGRDQFTSGYDIDFEDETGQAQQAAADEAGEEAGEGAAAGEADGGQARDRGGWQAQGERRDRDQGREGEGRRRDRWRDRRDRDDRPRGEDERQFERQDRGAGERIEREPSEAAAPERREPAEVRGPMLRDSEGGASQAPAFLQVRPEPRAEAGEDGGRRRRRRPRGETEGGPEADEA